MKKVIFTFINGNPSAFPIVEWDGSLSFLTGVYRSEGKYYIHYENSDHLTYVPWDQRTLIKLLNEGFDVFHKRHLSIRIL
jgi:hypothetical protein